MGEGRQVWARAIELSALGVPYAFATVVRAARPASCRPGDRAIIHADGRLEGWVGGSCAQPTVVAEALAALRDGESRLVAVTPHHDFPAREGMAVHPMTCISGGEIEVFVEPVVPAPQLIVCGASPVAAALVAIGSVLPDNTSDAATRWLDQVFARVCDVNTGEPRYRVHGLRMCTRMSDYPFASVDGSGWVTAAKNGRMPVRGGRQTEAPEGFTTEDLMQMWIKAWDHQPKCERWFPNVAVQQALFPMGDAW